MQSLEELARWNSEKLSNGSRPRKRGQLEIIENCVRVFAELSKHYELDADNLEQLYRSDEDLEKLTRLVSDSIAQHRC